MRYIKTKPMHTAFALGKDSIQPVSVPSFSQVGNFAVTVPIGFWGSPEEEFCDLEIVHQPSGLASAHRVPFRAATKVAAVHHAIFEASDQKQISLLYNALPPEIKRWMKSWL